MSLDNQLVSIPSDDGQVALYHLVAEQCLYDAERLTPDERQRMGRQIAAQHSQCCLGHYPDLQATQSAVDEFKDQVTVEHGWAHLG